VINVQHRLAHVHTRREVRLISTVGFLVGAEIEMARLESETSSFLSSWRLGSLWSEAKGILQRELSLSEEDAYLTLQRQSRQRRKSMKEVAQAIVLSDEVKRG
jgi:uroporphyrinogen-III synthase